MANFEEKWEKFSFDYKTIVEATCNEEDLKIFFGSTVLSTNLALICIVDIVKNFKLKMYDFKEQAFDKKLTKKNRKDMYKLYNFFLMDYFVLLVDNIPFQQFLKEKGWIIEEFEELVFELLSFSKEEKQTFKTCKKEKQTFFHSIHVLERLGLGKEAKNEAIVDAVEIIKDEFYKRFDENIEKFLYKK